MVAPELPVMVIVAAPSFAESLAVTVRVDAEEDPAVTFTELSLNKAVTPLGSPEADRLTMPVKPFVGFTLIRLVALLP